MGLETNEEEGQMSSQGDKENNASPTPPHLPFPSLPFPSRPKLKSKSQEPLGRERERGL